MSRASAAGITFTNRTLKAEWAGRSGHTSVIGTAGAIYVIGGIGSGSTLFQDVWASTDGGGRPDSSRGGRRGGYYRGTTGVLQGYYRVLHGGTAGVIMGTRG